MSIENNPIELPPVDGSGVFATNELFQMPGYKPTDDERTWALVCHLGGVFFSFIVPLVVMLTKGAESKWVKAHAVESLNLHITFFLVALISIPLMFILVGFCTMFASGIAMLVFGILAGMKGYQGGAYRFPYILRLIKDV
jgi:uncharacterized protein